MNTYSIEVAVSHINHFSSIAQIRVKDLNKALQVATVKSSCFCVVYFSMTVLTNQYPGS